MPFALSGTGLLMAVSCAIAKEEHRQRDAAPLVHDDPFSALLIPAWRYRGESETNRDRARRAAVVARQRYAEDVVNDRKPGQLVVLGAGLDTFALRWTGEDEALRAWEVDLPRASRWKRDRRADARVAIPPGLAFVECDLNADELGAALAGAGFDSTVPAVFLAIGLFPYLTLPAIARLLATVAEYAAGTEIVASYAVAPDLLRDAERQLLWETERGAEIVGEPFANAGFTPEEIEALVHDAGLEVVEHPTRDELHARYFANRSDRLRADGVERMIVARTMGETR